MTTTEQIAAASLKELAASPGPCITIALENTVGGGTGIALKGAINTIRKELEDRGIQSGELLDPLGAAGAEAIGAAKAGEGIVIFRSPTVMQVHHLASVKPLIRVNEHFDIRTLLSIAAAQRSFYILALSQNRTRILKCTGSRSEEIAFPKDFPTSLAESKQTRQPDHDLDNRASGGPSMGAGAVLFGTSSDRDGKDEYLLHFFSSINKAVHIALNHSADPLVVAGVEHEIALYRRVNTYPHLVEQGVQGAPDGLEGGEMHKRALELLRQRTEQHPAAMDDFDKRVGTGHASTHIQAIVAAAYEGRISHLFFQADAQYPGTYDAARQRVKRSDDPAGQPIDLIEKAALETLRHGGEVGILPAPAMPKGVAVCALFRYPATQ